MEMIALLKEVFQNVTWHDSTIRRWHRALMDGRESTEIEHVGRKLRTIVTCQYQRSVSDDLRRLSFIHSKAGRCLHVPGMSVQHTSTKELGMKHLCSMWVPHFLQAEKMEHSCSMCSENLAHTSQDPDFLVPSLLTNPGFIITILK